MLDLHGLHNTVLFAYESVLKGWTYMSNICFVFVEIVIMKSNLTVHAIHFIKLCLYSRYYCNKMARSSEEERTAIIVQNIIFLPIETISFVLHFNINESFFMPVRLFPPLFI